MKGVDVPATRNLASCNAFSAKEQWPRGMRSTRPNESSGSIRYAEVNVSDRTVIDEGIIEHTLTRAKLVWNVDKVKWLIDK